MMGVSDANVGLWRRTRICGARLDARWSDIIKSTRKRSGMLLQLQIDDPRGSLLEDILQCWRSVGVRIDEMILHSRPNKDSVRDRETLINI